MTGEGALAVTGFVLLVVAFAMGVATEEGSSSNTNLYASIGWVAFWLACACFIGAVWWAAA